MYLVALSGSSSLLSSWREELIGEEDLRITKALNGQCLPFVGVKEALSGLPCCKFPDAVVYEVEMERCRGKG